MPQLPDQPLYSRLLPDRAPRSTDSRVRESVKIAFTEGTSERLGALTAGIDATAPSLALALFAATVSRFCGDVVTVRVTARALEACARGTNGHSSSAALTPSATLRGLDSTLGVALDFSDDPSLAACGAVVQRLAAQCGDGQVTSASGAPAVASILFDFECADGTAAGDTEAEVACTVRWRDGAIDGWVSFDAERCDSANINALALAFATVADHASRAPTVSLSRHPAMDPATRQKLLVEWNRTTVERPREELIHHLFERQADATPEAPAVDQQGLVLSYRELNGRANHLARVLMDRGVAAGALVGITMERSPELVVALLAILKAGGAFVPLDPDLPPERMTHILTDTRARLLLAQSHLAERWRSAAMRADTALLMVPSTHESPEAVRRNNVDARGTSANPAYVIYTSGSTGQPKGVRVPHRALCNHARWFADTLNLSSSDRMLQYASIGFDAAMPEVFAPLVTGATVVLAAPYAHRDVLGLSDIIRDDRITVMQMVPSALRAALGGGALNNHGSVRFLVVGGEALDRSLVSAVQAAMPGVRLGNFYGPSETCVDATMIEIEPSLLSRHTIPIGRPIANMRCHILDRHREPVPVGAPGELYIGGLGLADGYHAQPELTASRFVADPFLEGERLYRSGDLARYCGDGTIEYLGRVDTQVKVRGYRIELSEIEEALLRHPGIQEAAAVVCADDAGEPCLVAFLVCSAGATPPPAQAIISRLRQQLPAYAVPTAFGFLDAMPLTPSAKLDRRALAQRAVPARRTDHDGTAAHEGDPIERRLRAIWEQMLGVSPVGLDDDFFALGGHSIKAIRVLNEVEREFGIDMRGGVLFEAPTVRRFAERLRERRPGLASTTIPVQPLGTALPLFFVPGGAGELFVFDALARELGTDQPLHVMDLYAFGDLQHADPTGIHTTLPGIAARMIADMRAVQAHGPYRLAGYSLGGNIAIEIAQQLRRAGEDVSTLVLFDCDAPGYPHLQPFVSRTLTHMRHALSMGPGEALRYVRERADRLAKRLRRAPEPAHTLFDKEAELALIPPNVIERMERALLPLIRAWESYVPQRYDGPVTLVRADIRTPMVGVLDNDPLLGWTGILTDLSTDRMPCGHLDILRPTQTRRLAEILRDALRRVDAR